MTKIDNMSEEEQKVILARREYQRNWRAANRDRVAEHNRRFYEKQAQKNQNDKLNSKNTNK